MIIPKLKAVFIHIPKTGGSAVDDAFDKAHQSLENQLVWNWEHQRPPKFEYIYFPRKPIVVNKHATYNMMKPYYPDWAYLTQVRHPLTRWRSIFAFLKLRRMIRPETDFIEWTHRAIPACAKERLEDFIDESETYNYWQVHFPIALNLHVMMFRQRYFLPKNKADFSDIKIYKLEDQTIWKDWDLEPCFQMVSPEQYKQEAQYNSETKELVEEYFAEDMKVGNY